MSTLTDLLGGRRGPAEEDALERLLLAVGRQEAERVRRAGRLPSLRQAEFRIFSQWGEDGIIQYLIGQVPIARQLFVEFGVQDYAESNTRFLLCNDGWEGLILDAGDAHREFVARRGLDWRHTLDARTAFVTRESIDGLLAGAGLRGDIGLLSVDIDGNDYWVWEAVAAVSPRLVVIEYNSDLGGELPLAVPYQADFDRTRAHHSNQYWGASLAALGHLARRKGYALVGSNSAGNNAFFVRRDVLSGLPELTPVEAHVARRFRDSRDAQGRLTLESRREERLRLIRHLPLCDVATGAVRSIGEWFGIAP